MKIAYVAISAVVALPLALVGAAPAQAQVAVPEQDVLFDPIPPWCVNGVCQVPSDEPTVTQGTIVKAIGTQGWLTNHVGAEWARIVVPGVATQTIPIDLGTQYIMGSGFDLPDYLQVTIPKALNWPLEHGLSRMADYPYIEVGGSSEDGSGVVDMITRIPIYLAPITQPTATMPAGSPRAVVGARTGQNAAKISWSAPTPPKGHTIVGYRVARNGVDTYGGGAYAKTLGAAARSFTMNYLVLGDTYTLTVQALYSGGTKSTAASAPVFIG